MERCHVCGDKNRKLQTMNGFRVCGTVCAAMVRDMRAVHHGDCTVIRHVRDTTVYILYISRKSTMVEMYARPGSLPDITDFSTFGAAMHHAITTLRAMHGKG